MRPRSTQGALVALACASFVLGSWTSHVVAAEPVVEITASLSKTRAAPGDTVEVRFHIAVPDGLHLYPPGTNAGLPISAKLAPDVPGLSPGDLDAGSAAKTVEIPKIGPTPVLEGTFDVVWPLRIGPEASAGHFDLKGTFTYQACKAASCYRPKEVPFAVALEVEEVPSFGPPAELPPPRPVRVSFKVSPAAAKQGAAVVLSMEMFVAKGYHTYPPGETSGDPVKVNVVPPPGISLEGPLRAPPGHEAVFFGEKCRVYEGTVQFEQTLRIAPDFKPGEAKLAASTTWQVCDDKQCFQDHGNGEVTLTVAARTASDPVATPPVTTATTNAAPTIGKQGLILTAIGAGIANLL